MYHSPHFIKKIVSPDAHEVSRAHASAPCPTSLITAQQDARHQGVPHFPLRAEFVFTIHGTRYAAERIESSASVTSRTTAYHVSVYSAASGHRFPFHLILKHGKNRSRANCTDVGAWDSLDAAMRGLCELVASGERVIVAHNPVTGLHPLRLTVGGAS